jgi:hypothetical protein
LKKIALMSSYEILNRQVSDDAVRNLKESYAISGQDVINVLCPHGRYDPKLQEMVSDGLSIGKVEEIRIGEERIGSILHLRYEDLSTLIQAVSDSGFVPRFSCFQRVTKGLTGALDEERYSAGRNIKSILKDSPLDKAYQTFFSKERNAFWELCLTYRNYMLRHRRTIYSFFVSL